MAISRYPPNPAPHATDSRQPVTKGAHLLVTNARKGERKERQGGRSFLQELREVSLLLVVIGQREFRDSLTDPQDHMQLSLRHSFKVYLSDARVAFGVTPHTSR